MRIIKKQEMGKPRQYRSRQGKSDKRYSREI